MELRQLKYFLSVAETEHLTRSADTLNVTQSTLSHGLRLLEDEIGVPLFDRIGRGLRLSQAGVVLRDHARRALQEVEAGKMALADLAALQSGSLTVGVIPTFLTHFVPDAVADFSEAFPRVHVDVKDLRAGPIEDLLVAGQLDMGISFHPATRAEIEAEPLFEEQLTLVVNKNHAFAGRKSLRMRELAGLPLALLPRSFETRRMIDQAFNAAGTTPDVRVEMESVDALLRLCRAGSLASIAAEHAAHQAVRASGSTLVSVALTDPTVVRRAAILWRKHASRSRAAQELASRLPATISRLSNPQKR